MPDENRQTSRQAHWSLSVGLVIAFLFGIAGVVVGIIEILVAHIIKIENGILVLTGHGKVLLTAVVLALAGFLVSTFL